MGQHDVDDGTLEGEQLRNFMRQLLNDLRALEKILADEMIETDVRRIGAEQEMFLIDKSWRPAPVSTKILDEINDDRFTTELALFNLEANLPPREWGGKCLSCMEDQILDVVSVARTVAQRHDTEVLLTGILPTIRKSDLALSNMTPLPRYFALNRALTQQLRGGDYEFRIRGMDELIVKHDSVMVESCNASFQVHFQVTAEEFPSFYNISQVLAAPVLAVSAFSPMLFSRRLWRETRIALFQQAVDTRISGHHLRDRSPRVSFGRKWCDKSVVELFQEDVARFKAVLGTDLDEDPFDKLAHGIAPDLNALRLFSGTVWRWNRACYGVTDGIPHLRIENRILPAGPTPLDEMANAAFWFGLISAMAAQNYDVRDHFKYEDVKANFTAAARAGLNAQFIWSNGQTYPVRELIVMHLLPMAREGLVAGNIDSQDIDRYLGVIEERVVSGQSGSQWMLKSFASGENNQSTDGERLNAIVAGMHVRQHTNQPVHSWSLAELNEGGGWKHNYMRIDQYMSTDLITVQEDEPVDLVASLMDWEKIRHIPVEDHEHRLVGLVSYRTLLRYLGQGGLPSQNGKPVAVCEIMASDLVTVSPETTTLKAIELMRANRISALPVVTQDRRLVGIVTERDFMEIVSELLQQQLRE